MRILALDAASSRCSAALLIDGAIAAERSLPAGRGQAALLAPMVAAVLREAGQPPATLDAVTATVGPGSFTGLRAALALAHGLAFGAGCPVFGVTVAETLAASLPPMGGRALWVAIDSQRRGRIFLDIGGTLSTVLVAALPMPDGPVALAGDAAPLVAAMLAARGADVLLSDARLPAARDVVRVAAQCLAGIRPMRAAQPLYGDAPEARLPAAGLRPAPLAAA